jgi:hypothetical protein
MTNQWAGAGMPPVFCILEGSANMPAAMPGEGRQLVSEPPTQLWGAAALARTESAKTPCGAQRCASVQARSGAVKRERSAGGARVRRV